MEYNPIESSGPTPEMSEKEVLGQQLRDAEQRRIDIVNRAGEFYDLELYEFSKKVIEIEPQLQQAYIEVHGHTSDELFANIEKYKEFKNSYIKPIDQEIWGIKQKIHRVKETEREVEKQQAQEQVMQLYQQERDILEEKLFNALEEIHSQIPQEARDVGMTTSVAMQTYLPNLVHKAHQIEYYMKLLEKVEDERDLKRLQDQIERERFFI
jgi:mevalonate kinase